MRTLNEVNFEELKLKDKVQATFNGNVVGGFITELVTPEQFPEDPEPTISIEWDIGAVTYVLFHSWCDKINYVGRKDFKG